MEKIEKFFEDYNATQKVCTQFYKEHWLGQLILTGGLVGTELLAFKYVPVIKEKIRNRKSNKANNGSKEES